MLLTWTTPEAGERMSKSAIRHRMAVQVETSAELVVAHADTSCQADGEAGRHGWSCRW